MEEKAQIAQAELAAQVEETPQSLEEIVAGLQGFGIEELEEILTITLRNGKKMRLRISNIPSVDEMEALIASSLMCYSRCVACATSVRVRRCAA